MNAVVKLENVQEVQEQNLNHACIFLKSVNCQVDNIEVDASSPEFAKVSMKGFSQQITPIKNLVLHKDIADSISENNFTGAINPYLGFCSISLVILGWCVVYRNAKKLTTRTESKSFIDDVAKKLSDIEKLVVDYWLSGRKERVGTEQFILLISAKLQTLHCSLSILSTRNINIEVVNLSKILEYSTLGCEAVDTKSEEDKREQVQDFLNEINSAHIGLYSEYQRYYKPTTSLKPMWRRSK